MFPQHRFQPPGKPEFCQAAHIPAQRGEKSGHGRPAEVACPAQRRRMPGPLAQIRLGPVCEQPPGDFQRPVLHCLVQRTDALVVGRPRRCAQRQEQGNHLSLAERGGVQKRAGMAQ